jgi:DNA repair protein RecO (recombination protein O)
VGLYRAEGIVLRTRQLGEADKILTIYTLEKGKITAVARGSKRARSRLMAISQPFTHGSFLLYTGRSMDSVNEGELINSYFKLREDIEAMAYATYVAELFDLLVDEGEPSSGLYRLLLSVLTLLENDGDRDVYLTWFTLRFISQLGYQPVLDRCVRCGKPLSGAVSFSIGQGGMLCSSCMSSDLGRMPVSLKVAAQLRRIADSPPEKLDVLRTDKADKQVMDKILRAYLEYRMERPVKSQEFLDSIRALNA